MVARPDVSLQCCAFSFFLFFFLSFRIATYLAYGGLSGCPYTLYCEAISRPKDEAKIHMSTQQQVPEVHRQILQQLHLLLRHRRQRQVPAAASTHHPDLDGNF